MLKWLKIILFLLSSCHCLQIKAQTKQETLLYGKAQYEEQNYFDALQAFSRLVFFDNSYGEECYWYIGNCYLNLKHYEKSEFYFDLAYSNSKDDSIQNSSVILKSQALLMRQKYSLALYELLNVDDTPYPSVNFDRDLLTGISYYCLEDYENAEKYFVSLADPTDERLTAVISENIKETQNIKINPRKARILSTIFPGLGQFYIGDIKNGANSILLLSGFMILFTRTAMIYSFMDGALAVLPWFQRYYMGGYKKAETLARDKITNIKHQHLSNIIDVLTEERLISQNL